MQGEGLVRNLKAKGLRFAPGLSEAETAAAEKSYGLRFPPDLRALVKAGVLEGLPRPVPNWYYNWRDLQSRRIREAIRRPISLILAAVEKHGFWPARWGERPATHAAAMDLAARRVAGAPHLIPIFGNEYLPQEPSWTGNPVIWFQGPNSSFAYASLEAYLMSYTTPLKGPYDPALRERASAPRPANLPFWDEWIEWGPAPAAGPARSWA